MGQKRPVYMSNTDIHIYIYKFTHTYIYMYVCMYMSQRMKTLPPSRMHSGTTHGSEETCVYVIYIHVYIYIHIYTYVYTYTYVCVYIHDTADEKICTLAFALRCHAWVKRDLNICQIQIYIYMNIYTHTYMYICIYIHMHIYVCIFAHVPIVGSFLLISISLF